MIEEHVPERTSSKYAAEGTVAHELNEEYLINGTPPVELMGTTRSADGFDFEVDEQMVNACEEYIEFIKEIIALNPKTMLGVEEWCTLSPLGVPGLDGGTADALLSNTEEEWVHIIDFKYGAGVAVDVVGNTQMMCYAAGALYTLGVHEEEDWIVTMTVVQPRAHHPDGTTRHWQTTSAEIMDWVHSNLRPAALRALSHDAPLVPSTDGCRFCGASGQCAALYEHTQQTAMVEFAEATELSLPEPNTMTPEQKLRVMDNIDVIRSFLVAVENQVKLEVDSGSSAYEGKYKLVQKTTRRRFTKSAEESLLNHLDLDQVYERKMLGITAIEKTLKSELGTKEAKELMGEITFKPEGATVISPESDRRKAVQPSVVSDFNQLGN